MKIVDTLLFTIILLTVTGTTQAALVASADGMTIYDTDLQITWLANANLAATNTFGLAKNVDLGPIPGVNTFGENYILNDGRMTWGGAMHWIAAMNAANYLGFNDWRLPTSDVCGYDTLGTANCTGSEMGHLFYNELGGRAFAYLPAIANSDYLLFNNIQIDFSGYYWTGTESFNFPTIAAFYFDFQSGTQADGFIKSNAMFAMAVRTGGIVDSIPPVLTVPGNITVNAASPSGAVVSYVVTATDNIDQHPTVNCAPASGSTFPVGTTVVSCIATDSSGNSAMASFDVIVKGATDQFVDLIAMVKSFNIKQGIENSLDAKLQNALDALKAASAGNMSTACSKLDAFINEVLAQSGKALSTAQANQLIIAANQVKASLGCLVGTACC